MTSSSPDSLSEKPLATAGRPRGLLRSALTGLIGIAVVAAIASMPWWAERGSIRLATELLCVLALAQMWNLMAGYAGLLSIGQQAFVGLGAYALVVFGLHFGIAPFWIVPLAGIVAALTAVPSALLVFRLRGPYFAVGTWVLAEVFRLLVTNLPQVSGGSGISIAPLLRGIDTDSRFAWSLWLALALGAGGTLLLYAVLRSKWGLALTAVRDSELAAEMLGVRVTRIKWAVYLASAAFAAMVGALLFLTKLRVSPEAAFSLEWTTLMFFAVVIGGIGTLEGPIIGTILYFLLREWLGDFGSSYLIFLGLLTIAIVIWLPRGLWGTFAARWDLELFPVRRLSAPPSARRR